MLKKRTFERRRVHVSGFAYITCRGLRDSPTIHDLVMLRLNKGFFLLNEFCCTWSSWALSTVLKNWQQSKFLYTKEKDGTILIFRVPWRDYNTKKQNEARQFRIWSPEWHDFIERDTNARVMIILQHIYIVSTANWFMKIVDRSNSTLASKCFIN